ncbi:unnamed protein product [Cladocopium goreaui]|uniref:Uncharacterized protein n=1 Tax=Cladocopium goreaui TaxID=2562237 RepID=A0A9P1DGP0_9DINO|nr:unnamed protein product [Cladocopium goreaui]
MADDEFAGESVGDGDERGSTNVGNERREKALMRKQILDDSSVAAFSQLGASFFAAARARLAEPRAEDVEPTAEAIRARHERMVRNARWRPSLHVDGAESSARPGTEELTDNKLAAPQDDFAKAAVQRLLSKRKFQGDEKEAKEEARPRNLRKTALSFADAEDDF